MVLGVFSRVLHALQFHWWKIHNGFLAVMCMFRNKYQPFHVFHYFTERLANCSRTGARRKGKTPPPFCKITLLRCVMSLLLSATISIWFEYGATFLYVFGLILIVSLQMFKRHYAMDSNKSLSAALMIAFRIGVYTFPILLRCHSSSLYDGTSSNEYTQERNVILYSRLIYKMFICRKDSGSESYFVGTWSTNK